jgi:hypothetical protein
MRLTKQKQDPERHAVREEVVEFLLAAWPLRAAQPRRARVVAGGMRIAAMAENCTQDPERWDSLQ